MIINRATLDGLYTSFKTTFNNAFQAVKGHYQQIVMDVPSSTAQNTYAWLGQIPRMREWLGDRVVQNIGQHDFTIKNRSFELTIGVDRDDIEDDQYGIYSPLFAQMGESAATHPDELVWPLLQAGWDTKCYDGQNFFDTDHPVLDPDGNEVSVSNTGGGAGAPWFLMDLSRTFKPIIWQKRRDYDFQRKDDPKDDNVFWRKEFLYGVDARVNAGFGLWQLAYGSKQPITKDNYKAGREAMMSFKKDFGSPIGIRPTHLITGPSGEGDALEILNAERDANGATNVYKGTAQLVVVPWLA